MDSKQNELKNLLYSMAEKLTKSPVEKKTGNTKVHSMPEGLQVTASLDVRKFCLVYSEKELDDLLNELEKEFQPDLGVYRTEKSIRLSRFLTEGGPWVDEFMPGIKFIYEIGKPIVSQVEERVLLQSRKNHKELRISSIPTEKTENGWIVHLCKKTYPLRNEDDAKILSSLPELELKALEATQYDSILYNGIKKGIDVLKKNDIFRVVGYYEMVINHLISLPTAASLEKAKNK
jgi:hypothetical protein